MAAEIESYSFGRIVVGGQEHTTDLLLLPERVVGGWWREEGHSLSVADLAEALAAKPETLVVGTGANGRMDVPRATRDAIEAAGIRLVVETTAAACQTYNRLRTSARVAAALHLTC
ncbi:MAG: hypothetical protein FJ290_25975 [Planctomycetes bacterium]|nr:hypothetical protein [Planctomycetota bacterium]